MKSAAGLARQRIDKTSDSTQPLLYETNDENKKHVPEKLTAVLKSVNWRKPLVPQSHNAQKTKVRRSRKSSGSAVDYNVADPATYWRKPVAGVDPLLNTTTPAFEESKPRIPAQLFTGESGPGAKMRCVVSRAVSIDEGDKRTGKKETTPLVMDIMIHECDDSKCSEHNGIFNNAEIRRIKSATRFQSQPRDSALLDFEKQLTNVSITPRKNSMIDLTKACKRGLDDGPNGLDYHKTLPQNETAIIHDPAVAAIGIRNVKKTSDDIATQTDRFQELLRKLQHSALEYKSTAKVENAGVERPRQDSGDSGIDTRSPLKRSLNPLAKEFSALSSKENPVVAEKRGSETSVNIPLSILTQIMGQSDQVEATAVFPQLNLNKSIIGTLQKFGIPNNLQQLPQQNPMVSPMALMPLTMTQTMQSPLLPTSSSPAIIPAPGPQSTIMPPPLGTLVPMQLMPTIKYPTVFNSATAHSVPTLPPPPFGSQFNPPGSTLPPSVYETRLDGFNPAADLGRRTAAGSTISYPGPGSQMNNSFAPIPLQVPNCGSFNVNQAPAPSSNIGPPPVQKPRMPDAMGQQNYEAYVEWRKANEPGYAYECKKRQARRAGRCNAFERQQPRGPLVR
ncbi:uncharacterized protein CTRU02_200343 [Colletotrichum truncatum]|uniref:Uncharacterized protein n=1 Tax=Colletotrichum truncatum TaxID=5467 RepID=A0ACC3ZEW2_COLTU|nr:uncharacterized protein CTRU02_00099 [Colletotrichum truncatum]KAF6801350.1 hypothetical protein CTRU02_00099 [Colletotrichum truncatum]